MWGVFIGMALGVGQFLITKKFALVMTGNEIRHKKWVVVLTVLKYVITLGVLVLMSLVSANHLFWTAGGMIGTSILLAAVQFYKNSRA